MSKAKQIERQKDIILGRLSSIVQMIHAKALGFDSSKINQSISEIEAEIIKQADSLIIRANKPKRVRPAKKILEDIDKIGHITPELLDEIKRSIKKIRPKKGLS